MLPGRHLKLDQTEENSTHGLEVAAAVLMGWTSEHSVGHMVTQFCLNPKGLPPTLSIPVGFPHHLPCSIFLPVRSSVPQRWDPTWLNVPLHLGPFTITNKILLVPCGWLSEIRKHISGFSYPPILSPSHPLTYPPTPPLHTICLPPVLLSIFLVIHSTSVYHIHSTERMQRRSVLELRQWG